VGSLKIVQFDEPSITSAAEGWKDPSRDREILDLPEVYKTLAAGILPEKIVSTSYGKTSAKQLDVLDQLPVDTLGLDFCWGGEELFFGLRELETKKGVVFGAVDNGAGDNNWLFLENPREVANNVSGLHDRVDLGKSYISINAETEQLPRKWAKDKTAIVRQTADLVNWYTK